MTDNISTLGVKSDGDAPDYNALNCINPLIEADLFETLDNVSDVLKLFSGMFVWSSGELFNGNERRRGGMVHQIEAAIAAVDFAAKEAARLERVRRAGGAA